jgi:hypothetical protein
VVFDGDILAVDVPNLAQTLSERFDFVLSRAPLENADADHLPRPLCLGSARRTNEAAQRENDREPDQSHGHLGLAGLAGVYPSAETATSATARESIGLRDRKFVPWRIIE